MRVLAAMLALLFVGVGACSSDDDSSEARPVSAANVALQLENAGLGCSDAHPNPQPEGGAQDSIVCTLATGSELTIDAFSNEDDLREFDQRSEDYACDFYPEAAGNDDETLEGFPYLAGRWWTAVISIEFDEAGLPQWDSEAEAYEPLASATGGEVVRVQC